MGYLSILADQIPTGYINVNAIKPTCQQSSNTWHWQNKIWQSPADIL